VDLCRNYMSWNTLESRSYAGTFHEHHIFRMIVVSVEIEIEIKIPYNPWWYSLIIESVDSLCRDSVDTQYMLIQTNFSKSPKQLTYKPL